MAGRRCVPYCAPFNRHQLSALHGSWFFIAFMLYVWAPGAGAVRRFCRQNNSRTGFCHYCDLDAGRTWAVCGWAHIAVCLLTAPPPPCSSGLCLHADGPLLLAHAGQFYLPLLLLLPLRLSTCCRHTLRRACGNILHGSNEKNTRKHRRSSYGQVVAWRAFSLLRLAYVTSF